MMDENKDVVFSGQQAGQPVMTPKAETVPGETQPSDLSEERIARAVKKAMEEFTSKAIVAQRNMESRLKKEVQRQIDDLKTAGVEVTPQIAQHIQNRTAERIHSERSEEVQPETPTQQAQVQQPGTTTREPEETAINTLALEIMQEYGVTVETSDPEARMIDQTSPRKFLASMEKAAQAKKARLEQAASQTRTTRADAQTVTLTGGGQTDLGAAYRSEISKARGNPRAITTIQRKYREAGLDI